MQNSKLIKGISLKRMLSGIGFDNNQYAYVRRYYFSKNKSRYNSTGYLTAKELNSISTEFEKIKVNAEKLQYFFKNLAELSASKNSLDNE